MKYLFLGIDTSCYATSLAVVDGDEVLVCNKKEILSVPMGKKGLSQSEALFMHLQKLPKILESLGQLFCYSEISGICVSNKPRNIEDSYMPVFTVGENIGRALAAVLRVPYFTTSHQESHIRAGIWSTGLSPEKFLALHISGGTSELLKVSWVGQKQLKCQLLGGTTDIHAGQFIDRIGVALGLPFPAGPHLELLAQESTKKIVIPSWIKGYSLSFSGPEAAAKKLFANHEKPADIARAVESSIAKSLEKLLINAIDTESINDVLLVGGVCVNNFIRERLKLRLEHKAIGAKLHFAEPQYSADNAVGTALIGKDFMYDKGCK